MKCHAAYHLSLTVSVEKKSGFDWHITLQNSANKENKYNKMLTNVEVSKKFMSAILDFSITWKICK